MDIGIGLAVLGMVLCFACMAMMVGMSGGMVRRLFRRGGESSKQEMTHSS